uniref:Uncharacterized protein n=1 Tax=Siphoviridae sp. ctZd434 TaxID=2825559 RepID=A0A8S5UHP8_9CAUD|nr:MAG TPA: hypothetical protein [Siphoviridae sp. ctZd434]
MQFGLPDSEWWGNDKRAISEEIALLFKICSCVIF